MNPKYVLVLIALAAFINVSDSVGVITITGGVGTALAIGGLAVLKAAAVGALFGAASRRGRRSVDLEDDSTFAVIAKIEPAQCYQRLICDLATGAMPKSENDVILRLFKNDSPVGSPKFNFVKAARLGEAVKDIRVCELQYSCPISGEQINKLI